MSNNNPPSNANAGCVGPQASNAGKVSGCEGCPNQNACASGKFSSPEAQRTKNIEHENIRNALSNIDHVILILSGKGGVGKSTVCCQLAHTLASRGYGVGVLDVDICGPSVARMLGVSDRTVHKTGSGWMPVYVNENLSVMSISFLLGQQDTAVVWRGPKKDGMIKQFLTETCWDEDGLNYLIIDTPPGTSDEHITIVQSLQGALGISVEGGNDNTKLSGAVMVTTPEEVAMMDVRKELGFCAKTKLPVLGVVENMSRFEIKLQDLIFLKNESDKESKDDVTQQVLATLREKCPEVLDVIAASNVFPPSGDGPRGMALRYNVPYLGAIPLDPNLLKSCDEGKCFVQAFPNSTAVQAVNTVADSIVAALPVEDNVGMEED